MSATAKVNDMRIINVVMGEPDSKTRNSEVASIFDYVYAQYGIHKIASKDTAIKNIKIEGSLQENVDIIPVEDVTAIHKKTEQIGNFTYDIKLNSIKVPLNKGDIIGHLILKKDNQEIKKINLTIKEDIKKANLFQLYYRNIKKTLEIK